MLSVFLISNTSRVGTVFGINVSYIVNDDFSDFTSFLIVFNNPDHVEVQVNVNNYLDRKFYNKIFNQNLTVMAIVLRWKSCFQSLVEYLIRFF